jgi:hypothetical protein
MRSKYYVKPAIISRLRRGAAAVYSIQQKNEIHPKPERWRAVFLF